jgi:hypothetical protein
MKDKIVKELLNLEVQMKVALSRVQELLKEVELPEPNPRKRRNLKQFRVAEIENYLDSRKFKKRT